MGSVVVASNTNPRNAPRVATVAAAKIPPLCSRHSLPSSLAFGNFKSFTSIVTLIVPVAM
jgi:hypothetical protein